MASSDQSEELVESALTRTELRRVAQMPLAHYSAHVACSPERLGQQGFAQRQALPRAKLRIVGMAEPVLIPTREQTRARRAAVRVTYVAIGETDPGCGQPINVWRGKVLEPLEPDIRVAEVIGKNHDDIRRPTRAGRLGTQRRGTGATK